MAIRTILHYPDPRLRQKAMPVTQVTPPPLARQYCRRRAMASSFTPMHAVDAVSDA